MEVGIFKKWICILVSITMLSGCGTLTGIPSHGGGKRFAIEQELIAATIRASIKDIDVSSLRGKTASIFIVGMGDSGAGSLIGGRASYAVALRGQHVNTPKSQFPSYETIAVTDDIISIETGTLAASEQTKGAGHSASIDTSIGGLGEFSNSALLNPNDATFLSAIIQKYLVINGIQITASNNAEYIIYVTVDVFGTIRSRTDWLLENSEQLKAKTAIEFTVIDPKTQAVFMPSQVASYEASYKEDFNLWMGPVKTEKQLSKSDGLLSDFTDITTKGTDHAKE